MAKFEIEVFSPDGEFQEFEIEKALMWLFNHDGVAIRGFYKVKKMETIC